jgi:Zn-dependent M16 (insulinase) family peptidase
MLAFSYNDPNLTNTLEVFSRIPDVLKNSGYTQKELDQHIITAYADYTTPKGEITFVLEGIQNYLLGKTIQDQKNEYMELKSVKLEDLPILGEQLAKAFQASQITVYGFPDTIQEHAELFETITDIR